MSSSRRWRALVLLAVAELLGMSPWFSASAVIPSLIAEWGLTESRAAWLTLAVQLGFVAGTLASAFFNLPDILSARRVFAASALLAAAANGLFALLARDPVTGIGLRFLTGFFLAGVYPPGMKIMATWFRESRGMAIGVLIGALTLGKASPYLVGAMGGAWRVNIMVVSLLATIGGAIVLFFVDDGPHALPKARFDPRQIAGILRHRGVRLANLGYLGHMWELYAMWTWAPVMIRASFSARGVAPHLAELAAFLVIGCGIAGCILGGVLADRFGRTSVTSWAMGVSGTCCVLIGYLFGAHPALLLGLAAVWGMSVIADSAQFSTCVTELGDPRYVGTALTLQTCLGFLLTMASIQLIPAAEGWLGWRYAFILLVPGPFLGAVAMLRLRGLPEAEKLAGGRG